MTSQLGVGIMGEWGMGRIWIIVCIILLMGRWMRGMRKGE
jgi:hypothetical protein